MQQGNRRAVLTALLANLGIAIAKFTGFLVTGAASLAAEAVHSVADTSNQALLLWGGSAAARRATPTHPFGYGRERYFWAFVVALILVSLGSVFAIVEGVRKFIHPHELAQAGWAVGILLVAIGLEGYAFRTAVVEARKVRGDRSWWRFVRETKNAELPVILLEDLGALVGLVLALLGVGLAQVTGNPRFDALGSIAIGILLGNIAWILAVEMKSLLIGEAASPETQATIERLICEDPSTEELAYVDEGRRHAFGDNDGLSALLAAKLDADLLVLLTDVAGVFDRDPREHRDARLVSRLDLAEGEVTASDTPGSTAGRGPPTRSCCRGR